MRDRLIELLCNIECNGEDCRNGGCALRKNERCIKIDNLDMCMIGCIADVLLANGVIVPPCKVGTTVYVIEPLWYGVFGDDENKCRKCEHFYEGGMGDHPDCGLGKNCCYHIVEEEADLRSLVDWIIPNRFTEKIAWGKTVFLTREDAEKALAERSAE